MLQPENLGQSHRLPPPPQPAARTSTMGQGLSCVLLLLTVAGDVHGLVIKHGGRCSDISPVCEVGIVFIVLWLIFCCCCCCCRAMKKEQRKEEIHRIQLLYLYQPAQNQVQHENQNSVWKFPARWPPWWPALGLPWTSGQNRTTSFLPSNIGAAQWLTPEFNSLNAKLEMTHDEM